MMFFITVILAINALLLLGIFVSLDEWYKEWRKVNRLPEVKQ